MAIMIKEGEKKFDSIPPGNYSAVCVGVFDLGVQKLEYLGKVKYNQQVRICWQVSKKNENGERYFISKKYTASLFEKASLRKHLVSWRGRDFTEAELKGFDIESVKGATCLLNIIKTEKDYTVVDAVSPLPDGMEPIIKDAEIPEGVLEFIKKEQDEAISEAPVVDGTPIEDDENIDVPF